MDEKRRRENFASGEISRERGQWPSRKGTADCREVEPGIGENRKGIPAWILRSGEERDRIGHGREAGNLRGGGV